MQTYKRLLFIGMACAVAGSAMAEQTFQQFLAEMKQKAVAQGVRPEVVDKAFKGLTYHRKLASISKKKNQVEHKISYYKYRNTRINKYRIAMGRKKYKQYKDLLDNVGQKYGVDPCILASIWGLETSYGGYMGNYPVIKSIATLAYEGRRGKFYRDQLMYALHVLNGGHVKLKNYKGEWAGASGHMQFLPSSWHNYAVDYNGDGRKDIWTTLPDAIASGANYLASNGWQKDIRSSVMVTLPHHFDKKLINNKAERKPVKDWVAMGIRPVKRKFPNPNEMAYLIQPDGGPYMLAFKNWRVIMTWNRSNYYAGSVTYLADQICRR